MQAQSTAELHIALRIKELLESLERPVLAPFLADWPHRYDARPCVAAPLPVLRWLAPMDLADPTFAGELVAALCQAAPSLAWRQTYTAQDLGQTFVDNYGWSEIIGGSGPFISERIACGFLILGPATLYPRHRHHAEELYLLLRGTAAWQQGGVVWREQSPGDLIHHAGDEPHAMRTGDEPLLALYVWRGINVAGKARLG